METDRSTRSAQRRPNVPRDAPGLSTDRLQVAKIQRSCVHDGPGIRTTFFFKGCAMGCLWCQNPELRSSAPGVDGGYALDDLLEVVERDREYYARTGGGVTLSGGEPLLRDPESLVPLLSALKKERIHVAVETALHVPWENISRVAPYVDLFFIDLKIVGDEELHKRYTGQDSRLIRGNIERLVALGAGIRFRMVILPGLNDGEESVRAAAELLKSHDHHEIELLKYHNMYEDKARRLHLAHEALNISAERSAVAIPDTVERFRAHGIIAENVDLGSYTHRAVFSDRVQEIRRAIRESDYHLCLEVSRLKTEFYKEHGFDQPTPVHRAERLAHVLHNKKITVHPRELLVGNFTAHRVGGQVWEEHYGVLFGSIIHQIDRQTPVSFRISRRDKLDFYLRILPFWIRHSLVTRTNSSIKDWLLTLAHASDLSCGFNNNMASIAHYVVNFERLLQLGTTGLLKEVETARRERPENDRDFYRGVIIALNALEDFAGRYAESLSSLAAGEDDPARRAEFRKMAEVCRRVPRYPARTYHEALQSMLLLQVALCIESYENAVSLGRLDQILYPYYRRDREAGLLTYDEARELLALFILKMDEVVLISDGDTYLRISRLFETQSTDQGVTAGGLGRDGRDATNDLTYMLLDICELQPLAVNMTARIHDGSPVEYLDRIAEVYINGAPMPALYNDEIYVRTLKKHYPSATDEDVRNYSVIGCVEPNATDDHFGNTDCANVNVALPFLQALKGQENDLWNIGLPDQLEKMLTKFVAYSCRKNGRLARGVSANYDRARRLYQKARAAPYDPPADMDELLERYQTRLNHLTASILDEHRKIDRVLRENFTVPLASTLFKGCMESGRDVYDGGATINSHGIQAVGITDVADSLHALNEVVYRKRLYPVADVIAALDHDFEGDYYGRIRSALLAVPKFGDDASPEAFAWVNRTLEVYVDALNSVEDSPRDGFYSAGYYALNVNIIYGLKTPALPSGRLCGVPLANSIAPHYGMQTADLLSSLNAVADVDFIDYAPNGTTVTFTLDASLFQGPSGVRNLSGLISAYFKKGGMQFQPNVVSRDLLLDAYDHPERYPHLLVRVAGYCAYFNDLSDELKKTIINRTCYH